ncbi:hypothetical protein [Granulicella paludicola]|uniref:hypothetical protein n=1 Tax=Granulicella paludicola TaxID=474951 RepID=UPI0021E05959|nr:hypothetical protein [Granulicella paludicola]
MPESYQTMVVLAQCTSLRAEEILALNGKRLPLHDERWAAAGKYGSVGWHTFRHTYRSWLDSTSAPIGMQQN